MSIRFALHRRGFRIDDMITTIAVAKALLPIFLRAFSKRYREQLLKRHEASPAKDQKTLGNALLFLDEFDSVNMHRSRGGQCEMFQVLLRAAQGIGRTLLRSAEGAGITQVTSFLFMKDIEGRFGQLPLFSAVCKNWAGKCQIESESAAKYLEDFWKAIDAFGRLAHCLDRYIESICFDIAKHFLGAMVNLLKIVDVIVNRQECSLSSKQNHLTFRRHGCKESQFGGNAVQLLVGPCKSFEASNRRSTDLRIASFIHTTGSLYASRSQLPLLAL